jgi:acetylornithine deacetylase/succinyl-diaminopimelate desuccinylase family protein
MLPELRALVHSHRDAMARFVSDLVALPSENPPGRGYRDCLSRIEDELEALGLPHTVEPVPGGDLDPENPRYWLRSDWGTGPAVYFHGHVDVVPAYDPTQFAPRVTEQTIFGRGSTDMKGGIASMIYAMRILAESGAPLKGRIALRVVPDEETGGALGSRRLSDEGVLFEPDAICMLTAEPTGGVVWHASRGAITCRITVKGRPSHVGLHYRGVNAFENMLRVARHLSDLKEEVERRRTDLAIAPDEARRSILMMGGEASGGKNFNVVPERFEFTVDRRINPEEDFDVERERLLVRIEAARREGADVEVDVFQEARPAGARADHPAALSLGAAIREVTGEEPRFELCPGILEIRFYAEKGVPAFAYGPGLLSVAHGPKEFIRRKDMEDCALVYATAAARILKPR